jgi:hypothetical protein
MKQDDIFATDCLNSFNLLYEREASMRAYKTSQGNWQLNFTDDGVQRTLYLGKRITASLAERIAKVVTEIIDCRYRKESLSLEMVRKVEVFPEHVRRSLERFGVITGIGGITLPELFVRFLQTKEHVKSKTVEAYCMWYDKLICFFGKDRMIQSMTHAEALSFYDFCTKRLSETTFSRGIRRCRTIFGFAVKSGLILTNPFCGIVRGSDTNEERQHYVSRLVIERILPFCLDDRERLMIVLGRFAGLRIPSEIRELRFRDFTGNVIRIPKDTKTGFREVPLFREVLEVFERLEGKPDELIFDKGYFKKSCWYRFVRAIARSDEVRWSKLWINCRSSCITDLDELGYSEKTLDAIFGNSALIRRKHYLQFRKEREYNRVLEDNRAIVEYLRSQGGLFSENDLSYRNFLLLRKILVSSSETEKTETQSIK